MTDIPLDQNQQIPLDCPNPEQAPDADHRPVFYMDNGYGSEPVHFYAECSCGAISVIYEVEEPNDGRPTTAAAIHEDGLEQFIHSIADGLGYTKDTVPYITLHGTPLHEEFPQSITIYD